MKFRTKTRSVIENKLWCYVLPKLKWFCLHLPGHVGKLCQMQLHIAACTGAGEGPPSQLKHEYTSPSEAGGYKWAFSKSKDKDLTENKPLRHGWFFAV